LKGYEEMIKILFVCHGNICRSTMAEQIMKHLVWKAGREEEFLIDSAATSTEEIGNRIYPPARDELLRHGIDPGNHRARQLRKEDLENRDLLIGMDDANIRNMRRKTGASVNDRRIRKLLEFAGSSASVADPWYTDDFETAYRDIRKGCEALLKSLAQKG